MQRAQSLPRLTARVKVRPVPKAQCSIHILDHTYNLTRVVWRLSLRDNGASRPLQAQRREAYSTTPNGNGRGSNGESEQGGRPLTAAEEVWPQLRRLRSGSGRGNARIAQSVGDFWAHLDKKVKQAAPPKGPKAKTSDSSVVSAKTARDDNRAVEKKAQDDHLAAKKTERDDSLVVENWWTEEEEERSRRWRNDDSRRGEDSRHGRDRQRDRDEGERAPRQPAYDRRDRKAKRKGERGDVDAGRRRRRGYEDDDDGRYLSDDWGEPEEELDREAELKRRRQRKREKQERLAREAASEEPRPLHLPQLISVSNLARALSIEPAVLLDQLRALGLEDISPASIMNGEDAALIALEYNFAPVVDASGGGGGNDADSVDLKPSPPPDPEIRKLLPPRPPVVTIMGHVDHGKTTLLDWLRRSNIAAGEKGGITQRIGAFTVHLPSSSSSSASGDVAARTQRITFLDTPGHAAFLTMRRRGAAVTDLVVLVVAADDGVMPQTREALRHAQEAGCPIIVAVTKIDKPEVHGGRNGGAGGLERRIEAISNELARHGVVAESLGGDVQVVPVSGITGQGMPELAEAITALAEVLDLRAETTPRGHGFAAGQASGSTAWPVVPCEGWILEASSSPLRGRHATVLVRRGTLRRGDVVVAGTAWARVRTLRDEHGLDVDDVEGLGPGCAAEVTGWKGDDDPQAGDEFIQATASTSGNAGPAEDGGGDGAEGRARAVVRHRKEWAERRAAARSVELAGRERERERERRKELKQAEAEAGGDSAARRMWRTGGLTVESSWNREGNIDNADASAGAPSQTPGGHITVPFIVKADVAGSVEAVCTALAEIGSAEISTKVLRAESGALSESDVEMANVSGATIVLFNAPPTPTSVRRLLGELGLDDDGSGGRGKRRVLEHGVIYHLVDDVRSCLEERLPPRIRERVLGEAEVLQVFPINVKRKVTVNIAGCRVRNGRISKNDRVRVLRKDQILFDGKIGTFRQQKREVTEIRKGGECGIGVDGYEDFQPGDQIQAYEQFTEKRHL